MEAGLALRSSPEKSLTRGVGLVGLVEIAPGDEQRQDLRLSSASGHLENVPRPLFIEHRMRNRAGRVESEQIELVAGLLDVVKPNDGFDGLALRS